MSLQKFRQKYDKFSVEGEKTVLEFLKHAVFPIESVYTDNEKLIAVIRSHVAEHKIYLTGKKEMEQMSSFKTPSSILAVFEKKENYCDFKTLNNQKTIYLDDIQDPGNVGTIIRIADWFGIFVIRSQGTVDFFHPKVVQATMGSLCNMKTQTAPLSELVTQNAGLPVLGALLNGKNIKTTDALPQHGILVIGNEGHGISEGNLPLISHGLFIPGHAEKIAESLNAAMACSILCYSWT